VIIIVKTCCQKIFLFLKIVRYVWKDYNSKIINLNRLKKVFPEVIFSVDAQVDSRCVFGGNNVIHQGVKLSDTKIGRFSYIASGSEVNGAVIGSFCSIGPQTLIGLGTHPSKSFVSTYPAFFSQDNSGCRVSFIEKNLFEEYPPVEIGNDVWIGARAMILDGIKVGDGAIIAAGAVVNKNVEPYSIVGGIPAKLIRKRFADEVIDSLLQFQWWNKEISWIKRNADNFRDEKGFLHLIERQKNESQ